MTSKAKIANMALSNVGVSQFIQDLDAEKNKSATAGACALWYEEALTSTLRAWEWPFARRYRQLALVEEDPTDEWGYSYRYPTDCEYARRILNGDRTGTMPAVPFVIAGDDSGRLIYTDRESAQLEYTARITDPQRFDPLFTVALSWLLGAYIAAPLSKIKGIRKECLAEFDVAIGQAATAAANEKQADPPPESSFITSRY